jgi:hypothetical protein
MSSRRLWGRPSAWLVVAGLVSNAPVGAVQVPDMVVWGRVVNALSGRPISGAVVTVAPAVRRPQLTDAQGRFLFRLAAAGIRLSATRPGYFYRLPWDPAAEQTVESALSVPAAHTPVALTIPLWPAAEIWGTIVDQAQRPVVGVTVRADATPWHGGARQQLSTTSDDRGQYRISDVRPGSYVVSARTPLLTSEPARLAAENRPGIDPGLAAMRDRVPVLDLGGWFVQVPPTISSAEPFRDEVAGSLIVSRPIYYSDTTDPSTARVLALRPGQSVGGIEFVLPLEAGHAIQGTVRADGVPRPGFRVLAVLRSSSDVAVSPAVVVASSTSDAQGHFYLAGVASGAYHVVASSRRPVGRAQAVQDFLWAEAEVDVHASDVKGVDLTLMNLPPFHAVVSSVGDARTPLVPTLVSLRMEVDPRGLEAGPGLVRFAPDADGRLDLSQLVPGEYAMQVGPPPGWVVHSLAIDGKPIAGRTILRSSRSASVLRLNLTSEHGSALVTVRPNSDGANGSSHVVVLFPAQRDTWSRAGQDIDRFRLTAVSSAGRAEFSGVLPGDYLTAAIDTDRPGFVWRDRRVLERVAAHATTIHVSAHTQASASVSAIPE